MHLIKLMKLLYLAERESLTRYGYMMVGDKAVSMDHGPILSQAYNLSTGASESAPNAWDFWISDRDGHELSLTERASGLAIANLEKLSRADTEILETVWDKFGQMNRWAIRDWMHENCAEWKDPEGSSLPIEVTDILRAVGYTKEQAEIMDETSKSQERIDLIFARH